MSLGDINVKLNLDGRDFTLGIYEADKLVKAFGKSVGVSSEGIKRNEIALMRWGRNLRDVSLVMASLPYAMQTLNNVFLSMPTAIVRANAEMERMTVLMTGLSKETSSLAAAQEDAQGKMDWLFGVADQTPYDLNTLTDGMVKLTSVGIDPMNGSLEAIVDSVAKFGGTSMQMHRSFIAIQQMAGKGVVSMEELRQQLGEAVPDAINLMARSMGLTMGELVKDVSKGVVEAQNALAAMLNQMALENGGSADQMAQTWNGLMNRIRTQWLKTAKELGDQGSFESLKQVLKDLLTLMKDPAFAQFVSDFGAGLADTLNALKSAISWIYRFKDEIVTLAGLMVTYKAITSDTAGAIRGGLGKSLEFARAKQIEATEAIKKNNATLQEYNRGVARNIEFNRRLAVSGHGVTSAVQASSTSLIRYNQILHNTSVRSGLAAAGLRSMAAGLASTAAGFGKSVISGGLWTAVIWGIYEAIDRTILAEKRWKAVRDEFRLAQDSESLKEYKEQLEDLNQRLHNMQNGPGLNARATDKAKEAYAQRIEDLKNHVKKQEELVTQSSLNVAKNLANAAANAMMVTLQATTGQMRREYRSLAADLHQQLAKASGDEQERIRKEMEERRIALRDSLISFYEKELRPLQEKMQKYGDIDIFSLSQKDLEQYEILAKKIEVVQEKLEEVKAYKGEDFDFLKVANNGSDSKLSALEKLILRLKTKIGGLRDQVEGGEGDLAKFEAKLKSGGFGSISSDDKDDIAQIRELYAAYEKLKIQKRELAAETKFLTSSESVLANQTGRLAAAMKQGITDNPFLKASTGAKQLEKSLAQIKVKFEDIENPSEKTVAAMKNIVAQGERLKNLQQGLDVAALMEGVAKETKKIYQNLDKSFNSRVAADEKAIANIKQFLIVNRELIDQYPELERVMESYGRALKKNIAEETKHTVLKVADEWTDMTTVMDEVWRGTMNSMSENLASFLLDGEGGIKNFIKTVGDMVAKAALNKGIGALINAAFGSPAAPGAAPSPSPVGPVQANGVFATGGIMTEHGKASLKQYANGGVANTPQIALFGEGSRPEAYVPLPDGRTIPVTMQGSGGSNVEINLINQSGQSVQAQESGRRFDGERMILDVVLKAASKPGNFQSTLKGALA